ncbi:protein brain tumor-like [Haliotis cracherodii]|uniref:brain tumor protein-like n=1 Tax=Haliotis rufescens TaxID=6454 RepID=UPI001EB02E78|nr:brain tumor protein-like [Haliotis rufescens]XP_046339841.1 brain tumor protein-like [Haliotis rufescens]XP_046339842.1 brain tumor protein-like [Haliotis rufescens]XP_046339844.1 brain tumor protein-like [Haliotis rufescens]
MASPTPSQSDTLTTASNSSDSEMESAGLNTRCSLCNDTFSMPKVLSCFHTFCQPCLEKIQDETDKVTCPECHFDTYLGAEGLTGLKQDYAVSNILETSALDPSALHCTGCKSKETNAVARCFDCANFLCANCVMAHQFMHCFEGHRVVSLGDLQMNKEEGSKSDKPVSCPKHKNDVLKFYCKTCAQPICKECTVFDHGRGHECQFLMDVADKQIDMLRHLEGDARSKVGDLRLSAKGIEHISATLQSQYHKAQNDINDTYNFYRAMLEERKTEALKELDQAFNTKQVGISTLAQKIQESVEKLYQGVEFIDKLLKHASITEALLLKNFVEQRFQNMFNFLPDLNNQGYFEIEFVSNFQAIQAGVRNTFGYVRQGNEALQTQKPQPIARPTTNGFIPTTSSLSNGHIFDQVDTVNLAKDFGSPGLIFPPNDSNQYEKWSSGLDILSNGIDVFSPSADPINDLTSKLISSSIYPPKSQIRRQKMIYHCRFGEFGVLEGQFTEPSGVAVNAQNDIIVADTNNHRIQIFDKEGRFKFQFGECGKRDGQLLYPNRVSVVRSSGDIIVTERSPTHQIQIYNQYGQFVRKFGANVLQHPRGVTVDNKGRIIIVECKVMRVIIFDQFGNVLNKFGCSKHLQFPNSVVVNDKEEIFISDNRAHCVKVFNYQGVFLRQIGGEGVTNYPIGVGINSAGEVLVADNHNNFNLTIFTQEGQLINALESKVKHAQCFDVALMDDGSVVLASKDYKLYIYKYM